MPCQKKRCPKKDTPLKFNSSPLKNEGWKTILYLLGLPILRGEVLTTSREYAQTATASVPRDGATAPLRHPELLFLSKVNEVRILEVFAVV